MDFFSLWIPPQEAYCILRSFVMQLWFNIIPSFQSLFRLSGLHAHEILTLTVPILMVSFSLIYRSYIAFIACDIRFWQLTSTYKCPYIQCCGSASFWRSGSDFSFDAYPDVIPNPSFAHVGSSEFFFFRSSASCFVSCQRRRWQNVQ